MISDFICILECFKESAYLITSCHSLFLIFELTLFVIINIPTLMFILFYLILGNYLSANFSMVTERFKGIK